jgi:transposase-like protein
LTPGPADVRCLERKEVGRVLRELSKVEQRYDAVLAVIRDGLTVSEAAIAYGVSRQTLYRWMQRYERGGLPALAERSHKPKGCPHQIDPRIEERIIDLRQARR